MASDTSPFPALACWKQNAATASVTKSTNCGQSGFAKTNRLGCATISQSAVAITMESVSEPALNATLPCAEPTKTSATARF
jgi:hypothetical protein